MTLSATAPDDRTSGESTPESTLGAPSPARGVAAIRAILHTLSDGPGCYRMLDAQGKALYVGKAKSLKKRVAAYVRIENLPLRLQRMVAETETMEIVAVRTEVEALLLEATLIKTLKPRYNILLKDDKSFPFLRIEGGHPYPRLVKHRGSTTALGEYFGPFASGSAVNATLNTLQRVFLLRSCSDSVFSSRTRPCLQYQIKRCSAPCVGRISEEDYAALVEQMRGFLKGKSHALRHDLACRMERHAEALEFERAAQMRDRLRALSRIQEKQEAHLIDLGDADAVAVHQAGGQSCIQVFFYRGGQSCGNHAFFPLHDPEAEIGDVLEAFLSQFYAARKPPETILLSAEPSNRTLLEEALRTRRGPKEEEGERRVSLLIPRRGSKAAAIANALLNAREALERRMTETAAQAKLLRGVAEAFGLSAPPERIEAYDNSHIQGSHAVGAMIVAGASGFVKTAYRTFAIKSAAPGDDCAMMREVLSRRFAGARRQGSESAGESRPDLILVDGGRGQLRVAEEVLAECGVEGTALAAIAKGEKRNDGKETYYLPGNRTVALPYADPVHYFLQRLRDEAHRFAIGTHRAKRAKAIGISVLDSLPGIGPRRKKALLHRFGSARGVIEASLADLQTVEGISSVLAKKLYDRFMRTARVRRWAASI